MGLSDNHQWLKLNKNAKFNQIFTSYFLSISLLILFPVEVPLLDFTFINLGIFLGAECGDVGTGLASGGKNWKPLGRPETH